MKTWVRYGKEQLTLQVPDDTRVIQTPHAHPLADPRTRISQALDDPTDCSPLTELASNLSDTAKVVIVISDITRPVPNQTLLEPLLAKLKSVGVASNMMTILIATGMHRPSTPAEKMELVGRQIANSYRIVDHKAEDPQSLVPLGVSTPHGQEVWVDRLYMEADLKIVTGFIEPHMMAGYSGGRKAVCPGLANLQTIQQFHGADLLANPNAAACVLEGNPCHEEALAVARDAGIDFLLNVVVNPDKEILTVVAGDFERAHAQGVAWLEEHCTISDAGPYDIVVTCGGGYPLDTTFYQAVKGMVLAEPLVKPGGIMVEAASCTEQIGSKEYEQIMFRWKDDWPGFLCDILSRSDVQRDQWELQVQTRVLKKIGKSNLFFVTDGIDEQTLGKLNVTPATCATNSPTNRPQQVAQALIDHLAAENPQASWAVVPDGPYIAVRSANNL